MELSRIRILHITNNLGIGGVQKIIYQLCGISKDIFSDVKVASAGGVYVERLNSIGVIHYKIPDLSTKKLNERIEIIEFIKKIVREKDINVIHCHHRMAVLYAKLANTKAAIVYNNHTIYSNNALQSHMILNHISIIADGVQAAKNVTDFFKIPEKNVTVINNAVDEYDGMFLEIPEITKERKNGKFIVMNSARLHPQKGMNYFVDAAKLLVDKGYEIAFFIVGDGPLKEDIMNQVRLLGLEKIITFLGFRNDIKNTIKQADLLVLTSIYEGLPLTPMEAFSVGVPVIATDIDGTREVVRNEYNGLLCKTKNPVDIAEKIEKVYLDRKLLKIMQHNSYNTYKENFCIEMFKKKYMHFYSKI